MSNYKDEFYKRYQSTHIISRKGVASLNEFKQRARAYQKQYGRFLIKNKTIKILDIGCGNGSIVWWLQNIGYLNSEGIDLNSDQIETGQKLGTKNLQVADISTYVSDKKNYYNIVFARDFLEHFEKKEIIHLLSMINNCLIEGGLFIVQVPNAESPFFGRIRYGDFTHEIAFTKSSLMQLLSITNFNELQVFSVCRNYSTIKSFFRHQLWKIIDFLYKLALFSELGSWERIVTQNIIIIAKKTIGAKSE